MDLEIIVHIWNEIKPHLAGLDEVQQVADTLIHTLIEHGVKVDELTEFNLDEEMLRALSEVAEIDIEEEDPAFDEDFGEYDE